VGVSYERVTPVASRNVSRIAWKAATRGIPRRRKMRDGVGEREFFIDNLLVRFQFIIEMIWWTGLAPWEFEFPFPGSLTSTFLVRRG